MNVPNVRTPTRLRNKVMMSAPIGNTSRMRSAFCEPTGSRYSETAASSGFVGTMNEATSSARSDSRSTRQRNDSASSPVSSTRVELPVRSNRRSGGRAPKKPREGERASHWPPSHASAQTASRASLSARRRRPAEVRAGIARRAQQRHEQPGLPDLTPFAGGEREQRVVAARVRGEDLVGHVAEQEAHLPERVARVRGRDVREQVVHFGRVGREARARMQPGLGDVLRGLERELGGQRQRLLGELHAERVRQVVHAVELPAPHARALSALLGADGEHQAVVGLALVEDLLL